MKLLCLVTYFLLYKEKIIFFALICLHACLLTYSFTHSLTYSLYSLYSLTFIQGEEDEVPVLPPLYITEFVLEPAQILFAPDEDEFQDGLVEVIKGFQDTVLRVQNLVPDTYMDAFTRYGKLERSCNRAFISYSTITKTDELIK